MTTSHADEVRKVAGLLKDEKIAMLTSRAPDGTLTSRPMAMQEVEFDGDLWFLTERSGPLTSHIALDPQVNVAVAGSTSWVSLTGTATLVEDTARKKDLWNAVVDGWFEQGPESPEIVLLRVDATSAEYWTTGPGGRVATMAQFVKSKVTGERFEGGESATVEM